MEMINARKLEVAEFIDDGKVVVIYNNKKYIRAVRKNIADQSYILINGREFLV
jgi:uncharacterized protein (DUF1330 family)